MNRLGKILYQMIPRRTQTRTVNYTLSNEDITTIVDEIDAKLEELNYNRANAVRIRLSAEESLLRWRDHFGADHPVSVGYEATMRHIFLTFRLSGESYNPTELEDEFEDWSDDLINCIGLAPLYVYKKGSNRVTYTLSRQMMNPAVKLLLFVFLGIIIGGVLSGIFPSAENGEMVHELLESVQNTMSRMINAVGSPVFFLTVTATTISAGKIRRSGNIGQTLMKNFILINIVVALITMLIGVPIFHTAYTLEMLSFSQARNLIDFFLQIIPGDIISPFITYDCAQLVLMGIVVGSAVTYIGKEVSAVSNLISQLNSLGLTLADWISKLIPIFVMIIVAFVTYSESSLLHPELLIPLIPFVIMSAALLGFELINISRHYNVPVAALVKKMKDSFMIAFRTASVDESFGSSLACCTNRFGINARLAEQSLPIGLVLLMPFACMSTVLFTLYVAARFNAGGSLDWYLMLLFLAVSLSTAIPPIPGGGIITYAVIFAQLGIPMGSLVLAMIMDTIFSFGVAAADQAILQLEMIRIADSTNMLDKTRLQKE